MVILTVAVSTEQGFNGGKAICIKSGQLVRAQSNEGRCRGWFLPPDGVYAEPFPAQLACSVNETMTERFKEIACPPYTKQRSRIGLAYLRAARMVGTGEIDSQP